jgi:hypothetical protein
MHGGVTASYWYGELGSQGSSYGLEEKRVAKRREARNITLERFFVGGRG